MLGQPRLESLCPVAASLLFMAEEQDSSQMEICSKLIYYYYCYGLMWRIQKSYSFSLLHVIPKLYWEGWTLAQSLTASWLLVSSFFFPFDQCSLTWYSLVGPWNLGVCKSKGHRICCASAFSIPLICSSWLGVSDVGEGLSIFYKAACSTPNFTVAHCPQ